jgi:hypothetical protein
MELKHHRSNSSGGGRWYVPMLTAIAAVATIWGISEQAGSGAKPETLVATER